MTDVVDIAPPEPVRFEDGEPFLVAGLRRRHAFADAAAGIAAQWRELLAREPLPGRVGERHFGVMCGADATGLEYMAGVRVASFDGLPEELGRMRIPSQRYAVFVHPGPGMTVQSTWQGILRWLEGEEYDSAHQPDFELYEEGIRPASDHGGIEIWAGVVPAAAGRITDLYERHAAAYDEDRGRSLMEKAWLDRFLAALPAGGTILDLGCGVGEPIARYLVDRGARVLGVDASPAMIRRCRARLPDQEWRVGDMRGLDLGRRFEGIVAWDSFFHLTAADQRAMFPVFARHAAPGAALLFTSGPAAGEAMGEYRGEPLYHASLDPGEYRHLLAANGFSVRAHVPNDADCGGHTVWLAVRDGSAAA